MKMVGLNNKGTGYRVSNIAYKGSCQLVWGWDEQDVLIINRRTGEILWEMGLALNSAKDVLAELGEQETKLEAEFLDAQRQQFTEWLEAKRHKAEKANPPWENGGILNK